MTVPVSATAISTPYSAPNRPTLHHCALVWGPTFNKPSPKVRQSKPPRPCQKATPFCCLCSIKINPSPPKPSNLHSRLPESKPQTRPARRFLRCVWPPPRQRRAAGGGGAARRSCARQPCRSRTRPRGGARWRWWRSCCWARSARRQRPRATSRVVSSGARGWAAPRRGRARRCTWSGKARRCTASATSAGTPSSWSGTRTYTTPTTSSRGSSSRSAPPRTPSSALSADDVRGAAAFNSIYCTV